MKHRNICQILCIYAFHGCKCSSKNIASIEEWMAAITSVKKETLNSEKNYSLWPTRKKWLFRNNYFGSQPFLMSCSFTKIFVHQYLPVITALCYFRVYKLIELETANIYLFKFNTKNTKKRCEISPKLTINTVDSRSVTLNICHRLFSASIVHFE